MAKRGKVIPFPGRGGEGPGERRAPGRDAAPPRAEGPDGRWIEVRRCRDQAEAVVVKGLLDSVDIPCVLRSRLAHSVHPFTVGDQGEVVILVPAADAPRARVLLARISPGPSLP